MVEGGKLNFFPYFASHGLSFLSWVKFPRWHVLIWPTSYPYEKYPNEALASRVLCLHLCRPTCGFHVDTTKPCDRPQNLGRRTQFHQCMHQQSLYMCIYLEVVRVGHWLVQIRARIYLSTFIDGPPPSRHARCFTQANLSIALVSSTKLHATHPAWLHICMLDS
jgi:hypothetical protein